MIDNKVKEAIYETTKAMQNDRAVRISRLQGRIRDLESRGFIKRQEFKSLTTGEFERHFSCFKNC